MKSPIIPTSRFTRISLVLIMLCGLRITGCDTRELTLDMEPPDRITEADQAYAGVFQPLDGIWEGTFYIYMDPDGQKPGRAQPEIPAGFDPADEGYPCIDSVRVQQKYESESPYYQIVLIRDQYADADGTVRVVDSYGINKVQYGRLWCILQKPDDRILLKGTTEDTQTIIWSREESDPLRIESFRESVSGEHYIIRGWGYYGDDDPSLTPKTWFFADYRKMSGT